MSFADNLRNVPEKEKLRLANEKKKKTQDIITKKINDFVNAIEKECYRRAKKGINSIKGYILVDYDRNDGYFTTIEGLRVFNEYEIKAIRKQGRYYGGFNIPDLDGKYIILQVRKGINDRLKDHGFTKCLIEAREEYEIDSRSTFFSKNTGNILYFLYADISW